ncbi:hypothetical protein [Paenibacillus camelliae]|uniref:hypothetical protein n=1 Tax=Paenibacillus camelliae TaxID=512410 RepID=UPI00203AF4B1|nr:hypothetical protein [Paenibacillus camelliae]MCM3633529.1 hypothetical protein [Paenibacillus camelliae]
MKKFGFDKWAELLYVMSFISSFYSFISEIQKQILYIKISNLQIINTSFEKFHLIFITETKSYKILCLPLIIGLLVLGLYLIEIIIAYFKYPKYEEKDENNT